MKVHTDTASMCNILSDGDAMVWSAKISRHEHTITTGISVSVASSSTTDRGDCVSSVSGNIAGIGTSIRRISFIEMNDTLTSEFILYFGLQICVIWQEADVPVINAMM